MNCPVRTDEDYLDHPEWNQNPPFLAPELTTRKDLNGTVNSREHDLNDPGDDILLNARSTNQENGGLNPNEKLDASMAGNWDFAPSSHILTASGGADQFRPFHSRSHRDSGRATLPGTLTWVLSLAICSGLSFFVGGHWAARLGAPAHASPPTTQHVLRKRASTCPGSDASESDYNTPLQIGAIFIILAVSGLACSFPTLAKHFPSVRLSPRFFFSVRHFGTGVLIATAFVHLLPTAFISLGDPCLSGFWTQDYPAMPGAISLAGIFLVTIIEMIFHPCRKSPPLTFRPAIDQAVEPGIMNATASGEAVSLPMMRPIGGRHSSISRSLSANRAITPSNPTPPQQDSSKDISELAKRVDESATSTPASSLADELKLRKDRLQCVLLEIGILFHSVFIGMALSVSTGSDFVVLLIAISFHQTFEGLALGSRIASIAWPSKTIQPWLMALAYGCTTPVGQTIGLGLRFQYSPGSEAGLLLVGIMNAISAGLLIFASLVELLSEDFLSDESWNVLRGSKRVVACFLVFLGAFLMSLIGAWA